MRIRYEALLPASRSRTVFLWIILLAFAGVGTPGDVCADSILFRWAFVAKSPQDDRQQMTPITKDQTLKTGDQLKFYIALDSRVFVYLVYVDTQGDLYVLFSPGPRRDGEEVWTPSVHTIPDNDDWFVLDDRTGWESFYLLASSKALDHLESLLATYEGADRRDKPGAIEEIRKEIKRLKRRHRKLASVAEHPVQIGGTVRSISPRAASPQDISALATKISAETFYSRTFTIDHQ